MAVQTMMRQDQTTGPMRSFITYRSGQEGTLEERIWLTWLLKLYEDNQRRVDWCELKKQWPYESKEILRVFTTWQSAERRLQDFAQKRKLDMDERARRYVQTVCATSKNRRSLDDLLGTLVRIQDDTEEFDKVPTNRQIEEYAVKFGTPWPHVYQRRLYERSNWPRYIRMYRRAIASTTSMKGEILAQIEEELMRKKQVKLKKRAQKMQKEVKTGRSRDELVIQLRRAQEYLGLSKYELPTEKQLTKCCREIGTPTYSTLFQRLGPHECWIELLKYYDEQLEIEAFMQRYQNLQLKKIWDLDGLLDYVQENAAPNELATLISVMNEIQQVTKHKNPKLTVRIKGKEYKLTVTQK